MASLGTCWGKIGRGHNPLLLPLLVPLSLASIRVCCFCIALGESGRRSVKPAVVDIDDPRLTSCRLTGLSPAHRPAEDRTLSWPATSCRLTGLSPGHRPAEDRTLSWPAIVATTDQLSTDGPLAGTPLPRHSLRWARTRKSRRQTGVETKIPRPDLQNIVRFLIRLS